MNARRARSAFTLVEVLVAIAMVTIVIIVLASIVTATSRITDLSHHQIDTASQAQLVFSRLDRDLTQILRRNDVTLLLQNPGATSGGEILRFFSAVDAPAGDRYLSLLAYKVAGSTSSPGTYCLQRAARPVLWANSSATTPVPMGIDATGTPAAITAATDLTAADYDVLASGVVRMALSFQWLNGTLQTSPPVISGTTNIDIRQITSLVVTLAVVDVKTLPLLNSTSMQSIANQFPDPSGTTLPLQSWQPIAANASNFAGIPLPAVQSIRVYQRAFLIGPNRSPTP